MKKPNQVIDEITQVIYPPAEAVVSQLTTIRAIIPSTIQIYKSTGDIHTIQPNLDMIQRAVDYLRGAPMRDELRPAPEDTLKPTYIPASNGLTITSTLNKDGEYDVTIVGVDIEPNITHKELFGEVDVPAIELGIEIPVICGQTYTVEQVNPMLIHFTADEYIIETEDGEYIKTKDYLMDEDFFQYAFLLGEGRTKVKVGIFNKDSDPIIFNITSHIHFKEQEKPPITEDPSEEENGEQ